MSITIRDLMTDTDMFGSQFGGESFAAWRALLSGFYGLPLDDEDMEHWTALTGREEAPLAAHEELWLAIGRRGGKSQCAALLAIFEACFQDYSDRLSPGEVATVAVLAASRDQARSVFRYISGLLHSNPMFEALIVREDNAAIELQGRVVIEVSTASMRTTRGYSFAAVIADEIAFWRSHENAANPDHEIINAIRPGMATLGGKLIALSSPYARRGALWENYRQYYGKAGTILMAQAPTRRMNPTIPQRIIDQAYERDEASAKAEYGAEFRSDIEEFLSREVVEGCTVPGRVELPPIRSVKYSAFTDPSGGSKDAWTLSIGHKEGDSVVVDAVRGFKPPFSPEEVVKEYAGLLHDYGIKKVTGDRYGGEFPRELFRKEGITYEIADRPRSDLYRDTLPMMNSGRVELPENDTLINQFVGLERRTNRSGKSTIDHGVQGSDDYCNSVAGVIVELGQKRRKRPLSDWL